jgi:general secretion pathway protein G
MKRGFTIIELLIVIAVISILIGLALPRFRGMQEEGNIAKAKGELRTLQTALESYYIHNNNTYVSDAAVNWPEDLESATPNIIGSDAPLDPFGSSAEYGYDLSVNGKYYVIYSVGPGGNGSATIGDTGTITETNGTSCIYVSNAARDTQP